MGLTEPQRRALQILAHGRSNLTHVTQQGEFGDSGAEQVLADLCAEGLALEVDRNLYAITREGREALDDPYPAEAGFLQEISVIHDAPSVKTVRFHGERRAVEIQVDSESAPVLAETATDLQAAMGGDTD
jgi:predicted transcriptional regulator